MVWCVWGGGGGGGTWSGIPSPRGSKVRATMWRPSTTPLRSVAESMHMGEMLQGAHTPLKAKANARRSV